MEIITETKKYIKGNYTQDGDTRHRSRRRKKRGGVVGKIMTTLLIGLISLFYLIKNTFIARQRQPTQAEKDEMDIYEGKYYHDPRRGGLFRYD